MYFLLVFLIILAYAQLEKKITDIQTRIDALEYYHRYDYESKIDDMLSDTQQTKKHKKKKK